jgi:hypothetical protein
MFKAGRAPRLSPSSGSPSGSAKKAVGKEKECEARCRRMGVLGGDRVQSAVEAATVTLWTSSPPWDSWL